MLGTNKKDIEELPKELQELVLCSYMTEEEAFAWEESRAKVDACLKCSLGHLCAHKVFGEGFVKAPFLFVGESPGVKEDATGRPFIGNYGKFFRKCMHEAGFRKGDVFLTNVLKCRTPKNRKPSKDEAGLCFMHLWRQLETRKPKVIVGVGSVALDAFIDKPKRALGTCRGDQLSSYGYKFVAVWHPAYVLQSKQELRRIELVKDLKKAFDIGYPNGRPEEESEEE